jgi:hypothetical protein
VIAQCPPAGIEPPVNVTVDDPAPAVTVPPQVVLPPAYTVMPEGSRSTSGDVSAAAVPLALFRVMVRLEVPPALTLAGLKDLLSDGETTGVTVKVATAGEALLPLPVFSAPAASELK